MSSTSGSTEGGDMPELLGRGLVALALALLLDRTLFGLLVHGASCPRNCPARAEAKRRFD